MAQFVNKLRDCMRTVNLTMLLVLNLFFIVTLNLTVVTVLVVSEADHGFFIQDGSVSIGGALVILYASCILMAVSLVVAIRLVLIKPIKNIIQAMNRLAAGDFTVRLQPTAHGYEPTEIREFKAAFNKAAEELSGTELLRKDFVNNFSHEFKTPIVSISGFADLLLPARHGIASPRAMPALWRAKLTDGYDPGSYAYVSYPDSGEAYRGRGFVYTQGVPKDGFGTLLNLDADAPLSDFGWEYLNKIADFCEENGIRLVLFTAPLPSGYLYNTENYQSYVDALNTFCAARDGLVYWDFSLWRDWDTLHLTVGDYSDAHHLNAAGADKFTAVLCDTIRRDAAGENVADLFYDTVEDKLTLTPDESILMKDVH